MVYSKVQQQEERSALLSRLSTMILMPWSKLHVTHRQQFAAGPQAVREAPKPIRPVAPTCRMCCMCHQFSLK